MNPGCAFAHYSLSRGAPSASWVLLHVKRVCDFQKWRRERDSNPRYIAVSLVFKTSAINRSAISPRELEPAKIIIPGFSDFVNAADEILRRIRSSAHAASCPPIQYEGLLMPTSPVEELQCKRFNATFTIGRAIRTPPPIRISPFCSRIPAPPGS